jgi:hypothetical protein
MSRALVVVNLVIEAEPEPLVNAIDHFEEAIRDHFAPYVVVNKCSISAKNTFSRPDASESGPVMASPTEGHGSIRVAEGYALPGPEVSCMDAAEMLVDGFIKDARLWPDPQDRNELVRRTGLLLSMQRESLKLEYNKLKSAVDTIPAAIMLLGGPPYKLTFTEDCLKEILESQK